MSGRAAAPRRYELIAAVLRVNIASGRLPAGLVLLEGPIAARMNTSRAPVQAALRLLEAERLIRRFDGRGYLVGKPGARDAPLRLDLAAFDLSVSQDIDSAMQNRGLWERVYDEVEAAVAACLVFGDHRIVEAELGAHFGVSRTVVRDVLNRLNERGLVTKTASSHWVARALTAQSVRERFELRQWLEPEALRLAAGRVDRESLARAQAAGGGGAELDAALMRDCLSRGPNAQLIEMIAQVRQPLEAASRALTRLGLPEDPFAAKGYLTLFELIGAGAMDAAAVYWRHHLGTLAQKNLARLKIVAIIPDPPSPAPYLTLRDE